jgi:hypothetical protein
MQAPTGSKPSLQQLAAIAAIAAAAAAIAVLYAGVRVRGLLEPAEVIAIFALAAWLRPAFRYCLISFAIYVAFSTSFIVLIYALGTSHWPLADPGLTTFDHLLGVDVQWIAHETGARPWLNKVMFCIYFSAIPQTIFLIVWFGFRNDRRLSLFLYRYMVCGLITSACFFVVPALGAAGTDPASWNAGAMHDLLALKSGEMTTINCTATNGIVTFPSFHTIWSVLLLLAMPNPFMIALNVLMIVSTITCGGHYLIDVLGGILVCAFVVPMTARQFAGSKISALTSTPALDQLAGA